MQEACKKLVGEHDFTNFCKLNPLSTTNHVREVLEAEICENNNLEVNPFLGVKNGDKSNPFHSHYLRIRGNAFLYHMIRCIMTVLYSVGKEKDTPEVVDKLFDTENVPRRPGYPFAEPGPLVLANCHFEPNVFKDKVEIDYGSSKDPANTYVTRIHELVTELNILTFMLGKREPLMDKIEDFTDKKNHFTVFKNSDCFNFEECVNAFTGKKKQRYFEIIQWKRNRDIEIDEISLEFEKKYKEENPDWES